MRSQALDAKNRFLFDANTGCTATPAAAKASLARSMCNGLVTSMTDRSPLRRSSAAELIALSRVRLDSSSSRMASRGMPSSIARLAIRALADWPQHGPPVNNKRGTSPLWYRRTPVIVRSSEASLSDPSLYRPPDRMMAMSETSGVGGRLLNGVASRLATGVYETLRNSAPVKARRATPYRPIFADRRGVTIGCPTR